MLSQAELKEVPPQHLCRRRGPWRWEAAGSVRCHHVTFCGYLLGMSAPMALLEGMADHIIDGGATE